jgi:hypothetical protein
MRVTDVVGDAVGPFDASCHGFGDDSDKLFIEQYLQYDLIVLDNLTVASLQEHAQQGDNLAASEILLVCSEDLVDQLADLFQLVVVANNQLAVVAVDFLDDVNGHVIVGVVSLNEGNEGTAVVTDHISHF